MKILLLADGWVGLEVTKYLREAGEELVGLIVHPPESQHFTDEIIQASGLPPERIWIGSRRLSGDLLVDIRSLRADIAFSVFWTYILPASFIAIPRYGCINFHCSFLPFNRGKNPNVWPIIDGTPAGVTLHFIDSGIDTGPIIAQREVPVEIIDTAQTLYNKLLVAIVQLFVTTWPEIKSGRFHTITQDLSQGTYHRAKDFRDLDEIDMNRRYYPLELINLLRARTFPPHPSAYFTHNGNKKVYVRIQLDYVGEE